ncbi:MAG: DUF2892 domain-containing protein [Thermodesulfovibrionales bacterium]
MKKNMGKVDRILRIIAAIIIGILILMGTIKGTLAIIFGIFAVAFLITSTISWCPAYVTLGISTKKVEEK